MSASSLLLLLLIMLGLVACGDQEAPRVDAAPGSATCTATFTGNITETSATIASCPVLRTGGLVATDVGFDVEIAVATVGTSIGITIDLGATPTPGAYSSETTSKWSALGVAQVPTGACIYSAGGTSVPEGSFALTLDSIDGATGHGTLDVLQYVLRNVDQQGHQSECGPGDTVQLELIF